MKDAFTLIIQFNQEVLQIPKPPLGPMPNGAGEHLVKCLKEEAEEFQEAHIEGDFVGCIDALIDSIYFSLGGLYKLGLSPEDVQNVFHMVHYANMTKKKGQKESRAVDGAADAIKPEGWISPERRIADYFIGKAYEGTI